MTTSALRRPGAGASSPPAVRARRPSWRDPRLAVGLALVCLSVVVGARVLASSDDTVSVLAARSSLVAGQQLEDEDLMEVQLRFTSEEDADRYLPGDEVLADGTVLMRPVEPGELVPRSALGTDRDGLVELPLAVDPGRVPASVRTGSVVDIWVAPDEQGGGGTERLLEDVPVLAVSRASGLGSGGMRQVVVGVPSSEQESMREVVSRLHGSLLVVRRQG